MVTIPAPLLSTVADSARAALVHDEGARQGLRLVPVLTDTMAADPDVLVLLDHRGAVAFLDEFRRADVAARKATAEARLVVSA